MAKEWLKRCCVGAMTAILTVSSLPMAALAKEGGVEYSGGAVTVDVNNDTATIGNEAISRTFSFANNHLKTTEINNKRANKTLQPGEGSEEFIIKRTKEDHAYQRPIDQKGWTVKADSEEKNGETGAKSGPASCMIDGNPDTYWHSQYTDKPGHKLDANQIPSYPHFITLTMPEETTFKSFSYDPRRANANGNIKGYELYVSNDPTCPETPVASEAADENAREAAPESGQTGYAGWTKVAEGEFDYSSNGGDPKYVNIKDENIASCENVHHVMLVATSAVKTGDDGKYAACAELDFYADKWVKPTGETPMLLKSSELTLDGDPTYTDTNAVINGKQKTGKKLSFKFQPKEYNGAMYSITENVVMYEGDHYMRKFLEISVPQQDALDAEIDYIDLESIDVTAVAENETWTIPTNQRGIVRMPKERANLGQPFYANAMFFGCEFPATDTQIEEVDGKKIGRPRYYTGKTMDRLAEDKQASRGDDGAIHYNTWQTVAGAARSADYRVVQADFFDYIDDISVPAEFRIQYNSWYDNEKEISDDNILSSFIEIDKELSETGVRPLDSYVVDDGWTDYTSKDKGFWPFNNKFPKGFDPSSKLVQNFGSNFGVWIGPRGGYGTNKSIAEALQAQGMGTVAGNSIDVADRTYLEHYTKFASDFQDKYKVNYWKWDGFADDDQYNHFDKQGGDAKDGVPGRSTTGPTKGHMIGGKNRMYHVTDLWEAWIDLFEAVRANAANNGIENFWISATTYTHPSPWFLQWVNSVWLQCNFDHARTEKGSTVHDGNLNARDACYYNFIEEHQFQFPLSHMYNHDPVYGKSGTGMNAKTATAEQFQNYLYTIAGRGTAFWELYYSDSIFDKEKYEVNAEFLGWVEENFHFLSNARMFGGNSPVEGVTLETSTVPYAVPVTLQNTQNSTYNTYGYAGFDGSEGILTVRNANEDAAQNLEFTFDDATLGVKGNKGDSFDFVVERHYTKKGTTSRIKDKDTHKLGDQITMNLQPEESLTIRVTKANAGDKQGPSIESVTHNGEATDGKTELIVNMDEKVKGEATFTVTVNGKEVKVKEINPSANDATYHIVLEKAPKQGDKIKVTVSGITDMAGNDVEDAKIGVTFHTDNIVGQVSKPKCPNLADMSDSIEGDNGFAAVATVDKAVTDVVLISQGNEWKLGVNADGYAYFTVGDVTATSQTKVTGATSVAGVRENNGMLKVYVGGQIDGNAYDAKNTVGHEVKAAPIKVNNTQGLVAKATVYDRSLGYDEIPAAPLAELVETVEGLKGKVTEDSWNNAGIDDLLKAAKDALAGNDADAQQQAYDALIDGYGKLVPGLGESQPENLALNKRPTASWLPNNAGTGSAENSQSPMTNATDGKYDNHTPHAIFGVHNAGKPAYMQIDLGEGANIEDVKLYRFWGDNRTYADTALVVSNDPKFADIKEENVLYYSYKDENNKDVFDLGVNATKQTYQETKDGKTIFESNGKPVSARYVRLYGNGKATEVGGDNHIVELLVNGTRTVKLGDPYGVDALDALIQRGDAAMKDKADYTDESIKKLEEALALAKELSEKVHEQIEAQKFETAYGEFNAVRDALQVALGCLERRPVGPGPGPDPQPTYVTVTFDDMVAGTDNKVVEVIKGSKVAKPEDPVREGYTFAGWYADEALTEAYDFGSPVNEDTTLYAKWTEDGGSEKPEPPVDPEDPNKPGKPEDPNKPGKPEDPNKPVDPNKPGKPGAGNKPSKPGLPQTGDNTLVAVGAASAAGIAMVAAGAVVYRRRKTQR